jgi:cysteamine dioxygenase
VAAESAAGGWSDDDVAAITAATRDLHIGERELTRLLALPASDHGLREEVLTSSDAFHASIFALDAGETIPLHDHPALTVICKVLRGRIRVRSFEWVDAASRTARDRGDEQLDANDGAAVLRGSPGTLHTITALAPTAFLDLFAPYYDDADRRCCYYRAPESTRGGLVTLAEVTWEEARR